MLKLCDIGIGVHVEKKYFKYYVISILVPITLQSVIFVSICIVAMETVAIMTMKTYVMNLLLRCTQC